MADYYDPLNPDFATEEQKLLQAQARIKALRSIQATPAAETDPGFTSAVTGAKIIGSANRQPILGALAPLIGNTVADIQQGKADEQRSTLTKQEQESLRRWVAAQPQTDDPAEILAHAGGGIASGNPLIADYGKGVMNDQLLEVPKRKQALTLATMKEAADQKRAEAANAARIEAARIGAQKPETLTPIINDQGVVTGTFGTKTGTVTPVGGGGAAGAPGGAGTPVQGKLSPAAAKAAEGLKSKEEETNDVLGMVGNARNALKDTNTGVASSLGEWWRNQRGKATPADINASALDMIAGQLASKYPRGPGSITDQERLLFVQYMGNVNNRSLDPKVRLQNLDLVEKLMNDSLSNARKAQGKGATAVNEGGPAPKINNSLPSGWSVEVK